MSAPAVTVLMPSHNRARLIGESIDSVLAQTFTDFELVVIDDGSEDDTAAVLAAVADARLRVVRQAHRGISAALNAGLAQARGRLVARLDSDDLWRSDLLATLVAELDMHPEAGVVYAQADALDHGAAVPHRQGLPLRFPGNSLLSLVYDDCTCNIALLARRECVERAGGYDEALIAHEDWDMWLRVARHVPFRFVDRVLARIRWHPGNLTGLASSRLRDVLTSRQAPLDKLFATPDLPDTVVALRSTAYANVHLYVGLRWIQAGYYGEALGAFRQCVRSSDRPVVAMMRIVWRVVVRPVVDRLPVGRAVGRAVAKAYQRLS